MHSAQVEATCTIFTSSAWHCISVPTRSFRLPVVPTRGYSLAKTTAGSPTSPIEIGKAIQHRQHQRPAKPVCDLTHYNPPARTQKTQSTQDDQ